ncbi:MAG: alpha/beta hydrolase [Acidobacteria bacterium]|nr:alpha/beta hydrolase [Acidobacteriota bacterium]
MGWLPTEAPAAGPNLDSVAPRALWESRAAHNPAHESTLTGNIRYHRDVPSRFLGQVRDVIVYLPPGYDESESLRYPVLYMQDGQNLFDGATAFVPGHDWKLDETAETLILDGSIEPLIIVGIYNTGESRIDEYTPNKELRNPRGGKGRLYGRFITEELKPFVDAVYRTRPGRLDTGIGGSSLGGLVSIYTGLNYPDVFSRLAILSPSAWWGRGSIITRVRGLARKPSTKIWLDIGTSEGSGSIAAVRALCDALQARGWTDDDLHYVEVADGQHSEDDWAARCGDVLKWLYPGDSTPVNGRR